MTSTTKSPYAGYRFPGEVISQAVWLYFRFPLSLRMVEEMLAARGITVTHETVRQWALKFGQEFANRIRRRRTHPPRAAYRDRAGYASDLTGVVSSAVKGSGRDARWRSSPG